PPRRRRPGAGRPASLRVAGPRGRAHAAAPPRGRRPPRRERRSRAPRGSERLADDLGAVVIGHRRADRGRRAAADAVDAGVGGGEGVALGVAGAGAAAIDAVRLAEDILTVGVVVADARAVAPAD